MKKWFLGITLALAITAAFMAAAIGIPLNKTEADISLSCREYMGRVRVVLGDKSATEGSDKVLDGEITLEDVMYKYQYRNLFFNSFNYIRVLTLTFIPIDWRAVQIEVQQGRIDDFYWLLGKFSQIDFLSYYGG